MLPLPTQILLHIHHAITGYWWVGVIAVIGAIIGFLSGLIGIGGGIILSPILLLLGWANMKQTAAISALFIFVNSLSGLAGQLTKGIHFTTDMYLYVIIAFVGGLLGAYIGSLKLNQQILKYMLATRMYLLIMNKPISSSQTGGGLCRSLFKSITSQKFLGKST